MLGKVQYALEIEKRTCFLEKNVYRKGRDLSRKNTTIFLIMFPLIPPKEGKD
jgi:hypothetical protein